MSNPKIILVQHYYDLPLSGVAELDGEKVFFDFTHNWYTSIVKFVDLQDYITGTDDKFLPQEVRDKLVDYTLPSNEDVTQIKTEDYVIVIDGSSKEIYIEGRERYKLYKLNERQLFELEINKSEEWMKTDSLEYIGTRYYEDFDRS